MGIANSINSFLEDQRKLVRDFYHLDYWDNHTLSEGFSEAMDGASEMVEKSWSGKSSFVQASAGAGMGLARLVGGIPICLNEWGIQVVKEIPKGPGATLYKFVEIPVSGVVHGIGYVGSSFSHWSHGSLNNQGSFSIAQEVTAVLGTAVLLTHGAKNISNGGGKFINSIKSAAQEMSVMSMGNGMAVATVGVQGALTLAGGTDIFSGIVWMSGTGESGGGTKTEEAGAVPKPEDTGAPPAENTPQVSFQNLLEKYGGKLLKTEESSSTTLSFRLAREELEMLEDLSRVHNVSQTLVKRIAIRVLMDAINTGENLLQRYGGEIVSLSRSPGVGRVTMTTSGRILQNEKADLQNVAKKLDVPVTTVIKLAIRLLRDTLNPKSAVKSPTPSLTMEASQSPFFPTLHRSTFLEIVSKELGEGISHVQRAGDNTVIVMTESGAVYEAKCEVVYEHIELRKMTTEK